MGRSEEHTSELQSRSDLVCRLLLEKTEEHTSELQSRSDLVCRLLLEKKKMHKSQLPSRSDLLDTLVVGVKNTATLRHRSVSHLDVSDDDSLTVISSIRDLVSLSMSTDLQCRNIVVHYARLFCFFNDTATTEIYTLSLHYALPFFF